jgi:hypothetical protein
LHQRGKPAGEQIRADQKGHVLRRKFQRPADDQGNGDRTGVYHKDMLQAERQQARGRQYLIDRMDFGAHERFLRGGCRRARQSAGNTRPVPSGLVVRQSLPNGTKVAQYRARPGDKEGPANPQI